MAPSRPEYIGPRRPGHLIFSTDEMGKAIVEGVRKLRYTPAAWVELDDRDLSADALLLLLLIRRYCDEKETDGQISEDALRAIAVGRRIGRKRLNTALDLLVRSERVFRVLGSLRDAHFAQVCFTANERADRREQWNRRQRSRREGLSRRDAE